MLLPGPRWPGLLLLAVIAIACGSSTDAPSGSPGPTTGSGSGGDETPPVQAEAPGPWVPSRALGVDRFSVETALRAALEEAVGAEFSESTLWTLSGEGVEARLELRTWFDGAEAERGCAAAAGEDAQVSLLLETPSWSTTEAVYVTRGSECIRIAVARDWGPDLAGALAVADVLVAAE